MPHFVLLLLLCICSAVNSTDLFEKSNLAAWCIVSFDAKKRNPEERAAMVAKMGLTKVAYDWRQQHLVEFEREILAYQKRSIESFASWGAVPCTDGEAFGLYVVEAIASGVPVVQPRHGAFPELIELTKGGILRDPDDVHSLAESLNILLSDDVYRQRITDEGMTNVRNDFTAAMMAERVESLFQELKA